MGSSIDALQTVIGHAEHALLGSNEYRAIGGKRNVLNVRPGHARRRRNHPETVFIVDRHTLIGADPQRTAGVGTQHPSSEEQTSELQSLMRISYAVFCVKQKKGEYAYTDVIYNDR